MNRLSLMLYGILGFVIMGVVVITNFWVGKEINEPAAVAAIPIVKSQTGEEYHKNPPLDPRTDPLTPMVAQPAEKAKPLAIPDEAPRKYYEPSLPDGDVLTM